MRSRWEVTRRRFYGGPTLLFSRRKKKNYKAQHSHIRGYFVLVIELWLERR